MPFQIIRNDITKVKADAIVNTANPNVAVGSVAFPLIATGVYGFPKVEALQIALAEINKFLLSHDMKVILVVFDRKAFELSGKLVGDILEQDEFRKCDEELWKELGQVVDSGKRYVKSLQSESILPAIHYSEVLNFTGKKKSERVEIRRKWHSKALKRLADAKIICTDPDNGLIVPSADATDEKKQEIMADLQGKIIL